MYSNVEQCNVQVGANRVIHTVPYLVNNSSGQIRAHSTATFPTHCPRSAMNQWIGVTTELPTAREEGGEIRRQGIPRQATLHCLGRTLATLPVPVENLKFLIPERVHRKSSYEFHRIRFIPASVKDNRAIFRRISSGGRLQLIRRLDKKLEQNWTPPHLVRHQDGSGQDKKCFEIISRHNFR